MPFSVQKFREMVLQLLYSIDQGESKQEDLIPFIMQELSVSQRVTREAYQKALEIWDRREKIDQKIASTSQSYAIGRIGSVEINILRIGIFELFFENLTRSIVIAEAIRLARKFSTPEAGTFINAILDAIDVPLESSRVDCQSLLPIESCATD